MKYAERESPSLAALNDHATQTMPTPGALRRITSRVPTPIALRQVHWYWYRFGHIGVWVRAPCWVDVLWHEEPPFVAITIKIWENLGTRPNPVSPTSGATPKRGSPYPNSRGHAKAWKSVFPTRGATLMRGSLYPQLAGPPQNVRKGTRKMKERAYYRRSPVKEFGFALGLGFCLECTISTSQ